MNTYLLLKTISTKKVMVAQSTRKDGTVVPTHMQTVHFNPDKGKKTARSAATPKTQDKPIPQSKHTEAKKPTAEDIKEREELAEADRQYEAVISRYKGTPQWMKAPNGEPTKLTAHQWIQVRMPNFKQWAGDWETLAKIRAVENLPPLSVKAPNIELSKSEIEKLFENAGEVTNSYDGRNVTFPKTTAGKVFYHKGSPAQAIAFSFKDVFERAIPIYSEAEIQKENHRVRRNIKAYHNYASKVNIDGYEYYVRFTVREELVKKSNKKPKNETHSFFVSGVWLYQKKEDSQAEIHTGKAPGKMLSNPVDLRLKDWFDSVNENDVTKIVDENGEPKVMYHQTSSETIEVFDTRRKGAGTYDNETPFGVFLKPKDNDIGLGNKQMQLFANIRNPIKFANRKDLSNYLSLHVEGYAELKKQLKEKSEEYEERHDDAEEVGDKAIAKYDTKTWKSMSDAERDKAYEEAYAEAESILDEWQKFENDISVRMKDLVNSHFTESGYDGVLLSQDEGADGTTVDTTIALTNTQVKSAEGNFGTFKQDNASILKAQQQSKPLNKSCNVLIDIAPLSCQCADNALEYLHKAMQEDGDDIFRPHENLFIRQLVEQMSAKGTDALNHFQEELLKWLDYSPSGTPTPRPDSSKFVRWTPEEMQAVRLYFASLPKQAWTLHDYGLLIDYLVQRYFPDDPSHMADYFIKRAMLMGRAQAAAENITEEQAQRMLVHFRNEQELARIERKAKLDKAIVDYGVEKCAGLITAMTDATRQKIKDVILDHQKSMMTGASGGKTPGTQGTQSEATEAEKESGAPEEAKESASQAEVAPEAKQAQPSLQTKLFDKFAELNRDWRRIAITEIGENANQGVVSASPYGSQLMRIEQYKGACPFCKKWNGKILTVVDPKKEDKNWDTEIWVGKTNVGRSASPYRRTPEGLVKRTDAEMWKPAAGLFHPHCRGTWVKVGKPAGQTDDFKEWLDSFLAQIK